MSEKSALTRARADAKAGKASSTQAGEFIREEFHHIREGIHGARNTRQAIAIGLSKARRAGIKLPPPKTGKLSVRRQAQRDNQKSKSGQLNPSVKRSRATLHALQREGQRAASPLAISRQVQASARRRTATKRSRTAQKAVSTKRMSGLTIFARKAKL